MSTTVRDERRPTTRRELSPAAQVRFAAMNATKPIVTRTEIQNLCRERGAELKRGTVGFILEGRWYNDAVAQALADLTGMSKAALWPDFLTPDGERRTPPAAPPHASEDGEGPIT